MTMETKQEVFKRYLEEYISAKKKQKTAILDTVCNVTGIGRKSAIKKLRRLQMKDSCQEEKRGRPTYYTADVVWALKDIWQRAGNEVCAELLHPQITEYVSILLGDKMWKHGDEVTGKLLGMSMGTMKIMIGNFLKVKRKGRGFSTTSPSHLKKIIPIFTGPWILVKAGSGQVDTVAHCGSSVSGNFLYSLNFIDIATMWDILRAQWNKGQEETVNSLECIRKKLPFLMTAVHPDTGSEFVNWHCKNYCDTNHIDMTRSRPNHKNDNAYVEERNGHIIRKEIGYIRLDCREAVKALNDVYEVLCPYRNHFIASRKCIEKVKIGSKYVKKYEKVAKTPYQRVLENVHISNEVKEKLKTEHATLNPVIMRKEIDRLKKILYDVQRKYGTSNF